MAAARHDLSGLLLAAALGGVALSAWPPALAQAPAATASKASTAAAPAAAVAPAEEPRPEVIIRATREADEIITARVVKALNDDPYLFVDHVTVTTDNGVVTIEGVSQDAAEMIQTLRLARRAAHGRRVVNKIDLVAVSEDNDK